jgi:hypothetical protein
MDGGMTRAMPFRLPMHDRRSPRGRSPGRPRWLAAIVPLALGVLAVPAVARDARAYPDISRATPQPSVIGIQAPALFRIFLKDGTALASFGEFVRVGERVIFSLPLGSGRDQLASVAASEVDWGRTDRYTDAVRTAHYAATRGEADYAAMSTHVAGLLTEVASINDVGEQMRLATNARRVLVEWPHDHFSYKADEVRQTLAVLDEVIAGLRARAGGSGTFDLSLVAGSASPPVIPLLEPPSLQDSIAQALHLAALTESPAERVSILRGAQAALDADGSAAAAASAAAATSAKSAASAAIDVAARSSSGGASPVTPGSPAPAAVASPGASGSPASAGAGAHVGVAPGAAASAPASVTAPAAASVAAAASAASAAGANWKTLARTQVRDALAVETRTDGAYTALVSSILSVADRQVARADVRGLVDLRGELQKRDARLGRKRPEQMQALLATLDRRLDAAQRLRLARDQWALKADAFRAYQKAAKPSITLLNSGTPLLNDIRGLSGPSMDKLTRFQSRLDTQRSTLKAIAAPGDLQAVHASLISAWQMADAAVQQRKRAITENNIALAWNASAAASGALMLLDHARAEMTRLLKVPESVTATK